MTKAATAIGVSLPFNDRAVARLLRSLLRVDPVGSEQRQNNFPHSFQPRTVRIARVNGFCQQAKPPGFGKELADVARDPDAPASCSVRNGRWLNFTHTPHGCLTASSRLPDRHRTPVVPRSSRPHAFVREVRRCPVFQGRVGCGSATRTNRFHNFPPRIASGSPACNPGNPRNPRSVF